MMARACERSKVVADAGEREAVREGEEPRKWRRQGRGWETKGARSDAGYSTGKVAVAKQAGGLPASPPCLGVSTLTEPSLTWKARSKRFSTV